VYSMVSAMEKDPDVYVASGMPFDVPPADATIWSWTMAQFRYNNMSEFMSNNSTFVWGGAMMLRKEDLDSNRYKLKDLWLGGGYSDDMQVQACAQDNGRKIATPMDVLLHNPLKGSMTFTDCWNFLRRQNFPLYTYSSTANWVRHVCLGFLYVVANAPAPLAAVISPASIFITCLWPEYYFTQAHALHLSFCLAYFVLSVAAMICLRQNLQSVAEMCDVQSLDGSKVDISHIAHLQLFVAQNLQSALAPLVGLATLFTRTIEWGGILYTRKWGRIVHIRRPLSCPTRRALGSKGQRRRSTGIEETDKLQEV